MDEECGLAECRAIQDGWKEVRKLSRSTIARLKKLVRNPDPEKAAETSNHISEFEFDCVGLVDAINAVAYYADQTSQLSIKLGENEFHLTLDQIFKKWEKRLGWKTAYSVKNAKAKR